MTIVLTLSSLLIDSNFSVLTSLFSGLPQLRQFIIVNIQVTLITYFILPFLIGYFRGCYSLSLAKK